MSGCPKASTLPEETTPFSNDSTCPVPFADGRPYGGGPVASLVAQEVECDLQFVLVAQDRAALETRSSPGGGSVPAVPR